MALKLKQDDATKAMLEKLRNGLFEETVQPKIDKALREFDGVHFARVVVIDDQYIMVITEFDGDRKTYTDFFRQKLPDVFKVIFSLAEGAPDWDTLDNEETFWQLSSKANYKPLGKSMNPENDDGYVFMAQGETSVDEISKSLKLTNIFKGLRDFLQS
jgi:hypothetical protein